jgi:RNA polymerase sigma-70 factor (ECF subfamily)
VASDSTAPVRDQLAHVLEHDGDRLYALALRVTGDRDLASDVMQDAFRAALEHAGDFRGDSSITTWLYRIIFNRAIDLVRRRRREQPLPDDEAELTAADLSLSHAPGPLPDDLLERQETRAVLEQALETLGPQQRAVFELRELEGRTTNEVAEWLGLTPGAVRVHLHRARLNLRAKLSSLQPQERS